MSAQQDAREHLLESHEGVLSTISVACEGYPFGSVVPFCLNQQGMPIILISTIAQHTKNIIADNKVSLIVTDRDSDDIQSGERLTLLADANKIDGADVLEAAERYYQYFPHAENFHETHNFDFYRLDVIKVRYIGGFGKIHWLKPEQVNKPNPFNWHTEMSMVKHMNADHQEAMRQYFVDTYFQPKTDDLFRMMHIDELGFNIAIDNQIYRFLFPNPVKTEKDVRDAMIALLKK